MMDTLKSLFEARIDTPGFLLLVLVIGSAVIAFRAQRGGKIDFAGMLHDDGGKPSAMRLGVLICVIGSTWVVMKAALQGSEHLPQLYWAYLIAWSGSPVLREAASKWNGVLPWSKP